MQISSDTSYVWFMVLAFVVMALALPLYNRIMLASFNPQLAAVRGVAARVPRLRTRAARKPSSACQTWRSGTGERGGATLADVDALVTTFSLA